MNNLSAKSGRRSWVSSGTQVIGRVEQWRLAGFARCWMLSCLQCAAVIFLWCNLYISIKQWKPPTARVSTAPTTRARRLRNM
jgi:hypothetical protein